MKVLIDPDWVHLAEDLSTEEKAELLMCILDYPNKECKTGLWRFIKKQLDKDAIKYKEKVSRIKEAAQYRWQEKSNANLDMKSDTILNAKSDTKSQAYTDSITDSITDSSSITITNTKKEKDKKENDNVMSIKSMISQFSKEHRFDNESKFEITYDFSFGKMMERNSSYIPYFSPYLPEVLIKGERSLIKKRYGQKLTMKQLISWLDQSNEFHKQDTGGE
ncbi:MAG: DUF6291 domain-containing protein [Alphaproteobacteria bacterium]